MLILELNKKCFLCANILKMCITLQFMDILQKGGVKTRLNRLVCNISKYVQRKNALQAVVLYLATSTCRRGHAHLSLPT